MNCKANEHDCAVDGHCSCEPEDPCCYCGGEVEAFSASTWTTTPPTEPGKWFWRFVGAVETHVSELDDELHGDIFDFEDPAHPREWWPVRIEEPSR